MSWKNKSQQRGKYANRSGELTEDKVKSMQDRLWNLLLDGVLSLAAYETGRLIFNTENQAKAGRIVIAATAFLERENRTLLGWIAKRLVRLFGLNVSYTEEFVDPIPQDDQRSILDRLFGAYGYDTSNETLIPGGYFSLVGGGGNVNESIARLMNQALSSEMGLKEFREQFFKVVVNPNGLGLLERHYYRFTHDLYMDFDRLSAYQLAKENGLDHAVYAGTEVEDTREFCIRRMNRVYTMEYIEGWNDLNWQGKRPGFDVKMALGGYNCRHILNWITKDLAEIIVKQRGIEIDSLASGLKLG
jgi:hypothetical protein